VLTAGFLEGDPAGTKIKYMQRKIYIICLTITACLIMLASFVMVLAVRLSDKGDIIDRNSNWIGLSILICWGTFALIMYNVLRMSGSNSITRSGDELINEIRKSNIERLKK